MALATIDIGSNSIRLLIGEVNEGNIMPLVYEREATRLASRISETDRLKEEAMDSTIEVLKKFQESIDKHDVTDIRVLGTSALREAGNSNEFLKSIKDETGIDVEVVTGDDEASLTARGVASTVKDCPSALVMDIGGGSTEFVFISEDNIIDKNTLPFGVVKLYEDHVSSDPPSDEDLRSLNKAVDDISSKIWYRFERKLETGTVLLATAGTATTLACIDMGIDISDWQKAHLHKLQIKMLRKMAVSLLSLPASERSKTKGLEPERADLIIPGILLTIKVMSTLGFKEMVISNYGLMEGALLGLADETDSK
jgi:exopolyphosphatase/guanosine-5'-triphosphate,3'-diphosphate pyrophosphatase